MQTPQQPIKEQPTRYFRRRLPPFPGRETAAHSEEPASRPSAPPPLWFPPAPKTGPVHPRREIRWRQLLLGTIITVLVALLAALIGVGAVLYASDGIAPDAQVLGIDIGGRSIATAERTLNNNWSQRAIALTYAEATWLVHPADLGVTLDVPATITAAHARSRTIAGWVDWLESGAMPINPVWRLDPAQTIVALEGFAPELSSAAQDATLFVENGRVQVRPASEGRALDVPATVDLFVANGAAIVLNGQLPLQVRPVSPAVTDVGAALTAAEVLLQNNIAVYAYDPIRDEAFTWVVSPAVWGAWLQLQAGATAGEFSWTLDEAAAADFFIARNSALGADRYLDVEHAVAQTMEAIQSGSSTVELRVFHTAVTHVVQVGETLASIGRRYGIPYPWIQQANPGLLDGLGVGQQITIPSPDDLLPYAIVSDKRIVVSIGQQRVRVYEAGGLKWEWAASTGISSSPTAPGVFQVQTHEPNAYAANWDLWMPNFMGIYQPVPTSDFMNGFHGFPTRDGANLLWTNNLGAPVTYGCILLGNEQAEQLYSWAEQGVVVEIQP